MNVKALQTEKLMRRNGYTTLHVCRRKKNPVP